MLNAEELDHAFVAALEKSWDERAIWPGCKDGYVPGVSADCYGQCLVGTLNAWVEHGGPANGYDLVPGIAHGPGLPENGVWHFQLEKTLPDGTRTPIDVTWHQFQEGVTFRPALPGDDLAGYIEIMRGSLMEDASLASRTGVILDNLRKNGVEDSGETGHSIAAFAQEYFFDTLIRHKYMATDIRPEDARDAGETLARLCDLRGKPLSNPLTAPFLLAAEETGKPPAAYAVVTYNQGVAELDLPFVEESAEGETRRRRMVEKFENLARDLGAVSAIVKAPAGEDADGFEHSGYEERFRYPMQPDANNNSQSKAIYYKDLRAQ